jgi:branched-chain amino acid transport system permease protein
MYNGTSKSLLTALFALAAAIAAPYVVYPVFLMNALILALFAAAFNLMFGYTGLLSFGHAAFYGTGAYVAAALLKFSGTSTAVAMIGAVAASMTIGCVMGVLAVRRRGIYFSMITLALSEIIHFIVIQWRAAGGEDGLQGVPRGSLFGIQLDDSLQLYYVVLLAVVLSLLLMYRIINSPFGVVLSAIRENEQRAVSLGYSPNWYLVVAFVLSAGLAGLAGALKTLVFQFATLGDLSWYTSGLAVLASLIGGIGTFFGPMVGGLFLSLLQSLLAESGEWVTLIMGLIFIACIHFLRDGMVPKFESLWRAKPSNRSLSGQLPSATPPASTNLAE